MESIPLKDVYTQVKEDGGLNPQPLPYLAPLNAPPEGTQTRWVMGILVLTCVSCQWGFSCMTHTLAIIHPHTITDTPSPLCPFFFKRHNCSRSLLIDRWPQSITYNDNQRGKGLLEKARKKRLCSLSGAPIKHRTHTHKHTGLLLSLKAVCAWPHYNPICLGYVHIPPVLPDSRVVTPQLRCELGRPNVKIESWGLHGFLLPNLHLSHSWSEVSPHMGVWQDRRDYGHNSSRYIFIYVCVRCSGRLGGKMIHWSNYPFTQFRKSKKIVQRNTRKNGNGILHLI